MAKSSSTIERLNKLEEEIIRLSIERGEYCDSSDYKNANRAYDKISTRRKKMYRFGEDIYVKSMLKLLCHENLYVKLEAAAHLLPFEEVIARIELEKLEQVPGLNIGFTAEMALKEWDKGRLKLIPE